MYYIAARDGFLTWDAPSYPSKRPVCRCQANIRFAISYKTFDEADAVAKALLSGEYYAIVSTFVTAAEAREGAKLHSREKSYVKIKEIVSYVKRHEVVIGKKTDTHINLLLISAGALSCSWPSYLVHHDQTYVLDGQLPVPEIHANNVFGHASYKHIDEIENASTRMYLAEHAKAVANSDSVLILEKDYP